MSPMTGVTQPAHRTTSTSSGGRLVSVDGRSLPLRSCSIDADARGGLARVVVRHRFVNDSPDPLQVTFQLPLPADAAVGAFAFILDDRRITGEIDRRDAARARFEEAILEGRTAALLEQERSALFTQEIGNIPAHAEVLCELVLDQKLRWIGDGQWEWRFPTVVAPRYLGPDGSVADRSRITVLVADQQLPARATLAMRIRDAIVGGAPTSPTHGLVTRPGEDGCEIALAHEDGAMLDRDITVRWPVAEGRSGVTLDVARPPAGSALGASAFGLVTVTPPVSGAQAPGLARDLIILMDTSGSMSGAPLSLAKELVLGFIASLGSRDRLELIEFSNSPRRWQQSASVVDEGARAAASTWVRSLAASGGTEMQSGLLEALAPLRPDAQRQVLIVTDGLVGFEGDVVGSVQRAKPRGTRVHAVGVGPATNRSLTAAVARAGGGGEFIVDFGESVSEAVARIVARLSTPLIVDLSVRGSAVVDLDCESPPDLLAGAPSLVPVRLRPEGGELVVEGRTHDGRWTHRIDVAPCKAGTGSESIARLFGRERVEDLEMRAAGGASVGHAIERIGLEFQIATRMTSWVAISEERTIDPREPVRRVRIPQQLPQGLSAEGLGLRSTNVRYARHAAADFSPSSAVPRCSLSPADREIVVEFDLELEGRCVSLVDGRMIIEVELTEELAWDPVSAQLPGARRARIDPTATTRPGLYQPGQLVRLVLTDIPLRAAAHRLREIIVRQSGGAGTLMIRLTPA